MSRKWQITVYVLFFASSSFGFNGLVHQQIIKSAFQYLDTHIHLTPATTKWLIIGMEKRIYNQNEVERILSRATVDVDYQADLWFSAWYHKPFAGGKASHLGMLTSLYHFLNVTKPGQFWPYDGYAYRHTDGQGNDSYLGTTGMVIRGDLSWPLGGNAPNPSIGFAQNPLGVYRSGFKGSDTDWQRLFFDDGTLAEAILPPSNIPAQMAYDVFLASDLAEQDRLEEWDGVLPVAYGYLFSLEHEHHYWRKELIGLPSALDRLGVTLHMAQDLAVPHHAQGIAGYCHPEFESMVDQLACADERVFDFSHYEAGIFDDLSNGGECQNLYDPTIVETFLSASPVFDRNNRMSMSERLVEIAKISARWRWGKLNSQAIGSLLPDHTLLSAEDCDHILRGPGIEHHIQFQYNLAVAATILIIEVAARDWEEKHQKSLLVEQQDNMCALGAQV